MSKANKLASLAVDVNNLSDLADQVTDIENAIVRANTNAQLIDGIADDIEALEANTAVIMNDFADISNVFNSGITYSTDGVNEYYDANSVTNTVATVDIIEMNIQDPQDGELLSYSSEVNTWVNSNAISGDMIHGGTISGSFLDGIKLNSSGNSITKSDGTTPVLSESDGAVTLTADIAKMGTITTMNYGYQTSASADKSMAVFGSNNIIRGVALQRDMNASFPDLAVVDNGSVYIHRDATIGGSATYHSISDGYVGGGAKIESHSWKNWGATGNYTARLYTPIVHNESNMFTIELDVYGYGSGGWNQRYVGSGYAFSGGSLYNYGTNAILGSLSHRLTTATHPNLGTKVVCFDLGYGSNNGTSYYNHMRWRYQGWNVKKAQDFVWVTITT